MEQRLLDDRGLLISILQELIFRGYLLKNISGKYVLSDKVSLEVFDDE